MKLKEGNNYDLPRTSREVKGNEIVYVYYDYGEGWVRFITSEGSVHTERPRVGGRDFLAGRDIAMYIYEDHTRRDLVAMLYSEIEAAKKAQAAIDAAAREKFVARQREQRQAATEWKAWFDAQPDDAMIVTDFGYAVKKSEYEKTVRRGFDGIE